MYNTLYLRLLKDKQAARPQASATACLFFSAPNFNFFEKTLDYSIPNTVDSARARRGRKSARKTFPTHPTQLTYNNNKTDMKATLLALLTLGSLAFGLDTSQALTLSTDFAKGGSTGGDGYSGIAFQLTPDTDRYVGSNLLTEDATYKLTGITIQWRNHGGATKVVNGVQLVVTNASDMVVLGVSNSITSLVTDDIPGKTAATNLAVHTFGTPVALSLETPYYAFYVANADIDNVEVGETLSAAYLGSVNLMAQGANPSPYTGGAQDFSFTKADAPTSQTFAPIGYLTVTKNSNVPEPMTGTLSLLALAGLCIRRRK